VRDVITLKANVPISYRDLVIIALRIKNLTKYSYFATKIVVAYKSYTYKKKKQRSSPPRKLKANKARYSNTPP
jgi:hypothetical protein